MTTNPVTVTVRQPDGNARRVRFDDGNAALKRLERAGVVVFDDGGLVAHVEREQLREIMRAIEYSEEAS